MAATEDTPRTRITWDYAPAPESADHVRLRDTYGLFIGGEFVDPRDGRRVASINPATEEAVAEVAFAGEADVAAAVDAARAAQPKWAKLPGRERAKYLFRVARLIQERARELAVVESIDGGKPIRESRDVDIPLAAAHFFYYAGWADKLRYGVAGRKHKPYGVVGQIVPWNFPLLMAAWKLAPALACGNAAILKPAETTPLTALLLAEIFQEAELPAGVANIVPGDGVAGAALVRSEVDKVAFTGSTAVGKDIQAALAGRGVGLTLELGGKSANIVFEDAAIDQAVEGIVQGIFFNQGHVCCAGSRLLIQEIGGRGGHREAVEPDAPAARRRPAGQEHRRRRHQLGRAARAHRGARRRRRGGGGRAAHDRLRPPRARLVVRADDLHRRRARPPHRGRGDLRPGRLGARPSAARRRRSRRPTTRVTASPRASGPTRARRPSRSPPR